MKTDPDTIRHFLNQARDRAMQMMENGSFIRKELPSLRMPDALRQKLDVLCESLIGTKYDLIHEVYGIDELLDGSPESPAIAQGVERIRQWIFESNMEFNDCAKEVQRAMELGEADALLSILIMESGTNILSAAVTFPEVRPETSAAKLTPEEREELLASCRQVEARRRAERNEEACEPSSYDEEDDDDGDDDEKESEYDPNCYAFYSEDSYPIGLLIAAIRRLMARPDLPAETAENLKVFMFAMERLPLVTPGVSMSLGLRYEMRGESDWIEIRMEDGEFTLGRGTWVDGDADTEADFEVTPDYREGDAFIATGFAESFAECARDVCREVVIEDTSVEPFTGWNLERDKTRWASLPCSFL
jgi:hypothetical protein